MTTPSVLIPDPNQVALDFLRENYPIWFVPNIAQTQRYPVDVVNTIYAALKQAMIATVKEDISDTSKPDDRTQSDLSSSDRTLIAAKEETPQDRHDALTAFRLAMSRHRTANNLYISSKDEAVIISALSQSKQPQDVKAILDKLDAGLSAATSSPDPYLTLAKHVMDARSLVSQSKDGWQIPEGYALVPIEPTDSMIKSGQTCANPYNLFSIWAAMIFACKGK